MRRWQVGVPAMLAAVAMAAAEEPAASKIDWLAPQIGPGVFTDRLGMLDREREEYAAHLAGHAANRIAAAGASAASLKDARRFVALSLHLAPRCRKALVLNFQLSRGLLPQRDDSVMSPEVLAGLLFTRAKLLAGQGGAEDALAGRAFIELAAELDPKNEDAVYASELQRIDGNGVDWPSLTDVKRPAKGGSAKEVP